jgi:hypothetical protein
MPASNARFPVIGPFAFYRVVPLHSSYMRLALLIVTGLGTVMLVVNPLSGEQVVVPVVALQMFAASTGFAVPARRGHYDLLMTGGAGRLQIAATHLLLSVAPGLAAWLVLGSVELALTVGGSRAFATGSVAALMFVSSLAWAATVPLPRLSGGIMWLLAIVMLLARSDGWRGAAVAARDGTSSAESALLYALCPFVLVGRSLAWADAWVLLPGMALSVLSVASALVWVTRMDVPLEASQ